MKMYPTEKTDGQIAAMFDGMNTSEMLAIGERVAADCFIVPNEYLAKNWQGGENCPELTQHLYGLGWHKAPTVKGRPLLEVAEKLEKRIVTNSVNRQIREKQQQMRETTLLGYCDNYQESDIPESKHDGGDGPIINYEVDEPRQKEKMIEFLAEFDPDGLTEIREAAKAIHKV